MVDRSLKVLEFFCLLDLLKEFSVSPLGRKRCEELRPSCQLPLIRSRMAEVLELKTILETLGDFPVRGLKDITAILEQLEVQGAVLAIQGLLDIHQQIDLCKGLKRFFQKLDNVPVPRLQEKISKLSSLNTLEKEVFRAVNIKGEILDQASPALSDIRHRLGEVREKAKGVLEHLLHREDLQIVFQEQIITVRNGRYVLLIKSEYKNHLKGIIHDQSQSHMSFFFEPLQVVPFNNEINILTGEEKEEEYRILADLSNKIRGELTSLREDFEILGELDFLYALSRFSILLKSSEPQLSEDGGIEMKKARNPFLVLQEEGYVVPIDLRMEEGIKVLILSGANAGGKTVALKTLGLLTLMAQCGLPIPAAEGSRVRVFQDVFAVIGDEQNIGENLSTFSSHLLHVNQILQQAGPRSLVLLDELGVGTQASEGCALAMGFLDQFREKGASVLVTTHFDRLKVYGYLQSDVENVAVEFNEETLEPRYTLFYGSPGLSNAFLVAEKLGISRKVLERAGHHRDGGDQEVTRALETLGRLKADTEGQRSQLIQLKEEAENERRRLREIVEKIKEKREEILSKAEAKGRKLVQKTEDDLKEWMNQWKAEKERLNVASIKEYRKEISELKEKISAPLRKREDRAVLSSLKVGERVRIGSLKKQGILTKVEETFRRAEVLTDRAKVKVPFSEIVPVREEEEEGKSELPKDPRLFHGEHSSPPSQLNVIGLTVEDALSEVDHFIDQALLHGQEKVLIIHGVGSGRLREAIGKYLREHQAVKNVAPGDVRKGGRGITLVELR
jgi:DNA mismatch repair protein MutS2